jgi:hypothetical protein
LSGPEEEEEEGVEEEDDFDLEALEGLGPEMVFADLTLPMMMRAGLEERKEVGREKERGKVHRLG